MVESNRTLSLRDRRRIETRRTIQDHALALFAERGYDGTTVQDVAAAAGVSAMTLYRHFPTKEDLVLVDHIGDLVADAVRAQPAGLTLVDRIGRGLVDAARTATSPEDGGRGSVLARLRLMTSTPALRARHLDGQLALQEAIVAAVVGDDPDPETAYAARAAAGACLAALYLALVRWADEDGRSDLGTLLGTALAAAFDGTAFDAAEVSPSRGRHPS